MSALPAIDLALPNHDTNKAEAQLKALEDLNEQIRNAGECLMQNAKITADTLQGAVIEIETQGTATSLLVGLDLLQSVLTLTQSIVSVANRCPAEVNDCIQTLSNSFDILGELFEKQAPLSEAGAVVSDIVIPALEKLHDLDDVWENTSIELNLI